MTVGLEVAGCAWLTASTQLELAVEEIEISLSTLNPRIKSTEIKAVKKGRHVYVLM